MNKDNQVLTNYIQTKVLLILLGGFLFSGITYAQDDLRSNSSQLKSVNVKLSNLLQSQPPTNVDLSSYLNGQITILWSPPNLSGNTGPSPHVVGNPSASSANFCIDCVCPTTGCDENPVVTNLEYLIEESVNGGPFQQIHTLYIGTADTRDFKTESLSIQRPTGEYRYTIKVKYNNYDYNQFVQIHSVNHAALSTPSLQESNESLVWNAPPTAISTELEYAQCNSPCGNISQSQWHDIEPTSNTSLSLIPFNITHNAFRLRHCKTIGVVSCTNWSSIYKHNIPKASLNLIWVPISVGDITTFIPVDNNTSAIPEDYNIQLSERDGNRYVTWSTQVPATRFEIQGLNSQGQWVTITYTDNYGVLLDSSYSQFTKIRVLACNGNVCGQLGSSPEVGVDTFLNIIPTPATIIVPPENITSTSLAIIPGEIQVSEQGAATYNIPFVLPAGKGGYKPQINLSYSSLSTSLQNIAGLGWSINTYSSIGRCQKTLESDGNFRNVEFTNEDALCLDGEKLRLFSGINLTNGAEYRLDSDTSIKIIQSGNGSYANFEVFKPSGEVLSYGATANSKFYDYKTNEVYTWFLASKQNTFSQQIDYQYLHSSNGEVNIDSITYAGNTIDFQYELRNDASTLYDLGNLKEVTKRLNKVLISNHNNDLVRSYHFDYRYSEFSDRSLLNSLTLCNGSLSGVCGKPSVFEYSDEDLAGLNDYDTVLTLSNYTSVTGNDFCSTENSKLKVVGYCDIYNVRVADINNDGSAELIVNTRYGDQGKTLVFEYVNGAFSLNNNLSDFNQTIHKNSVQGQILTYRFQWGLVDDNGDGIYQITNNNILYYDWDGDGVDERSPGATANVRAYESEYSYPYNAWLEYELQAQGQDIIFDFNGDGLMDRFVSFEEYAERVVSDDGFWDSETTFEGQHWLLEINRTVNGVYEGEVLYLPNPPSGCGNTTGNECFPDIELQDVEGLYSGAMTRSYHTDMNGDGISDFQPGLSGMATGRKFDTVTNNFHIAHSLRWGVNAVPLSDIVDINSDGKDDSVYYDNVSRQLFWRQSYSNTNSAPFVLTNTNWASIAKTAKYAWADLDGDDQPELIYFDQKTQKIRIKFDKNNNEKILDKLTSVATGLGKEYNLTYKRLTDSSVYHQGTGAVNLNWGNGAKVRDIKSTMPVVSALTETQTITSTGDSLSDTTSYFYEGLRSQAGGKGSLGFAKVRTTRESDSQSTTSYYKQQPPYNGRLYKQETSIDGVLTRKYEVTQWWELPITSNTSYFVAPKLELINEYYVNSSSGIISNNTLAKQITVTTNYSITNNDYPQRNSQTRVEDDQFTYLTKTQTTAFLYNNEDTTNWYIQRPTETTITHARSNQATVVQQSTINYHDSYNVQSSIIRSPNSTDKTLYLNTNFVYDIYGNRIQKTICSLHFAYSCDAVSVPDTSNDNKKVFRRKNYAFNSQGRYLTRISNSEFIEKSFHGYNQFGLPTEIRSNQYNNNQGQREYRYYNSLGVLYFSYLNDGSSAHIDISDCNTRTDCPINASIAVLTEHNAQPNRKQFINFVGQVVREGTQLLDGSWSYSNKSYDIYGREIRVSQPFKTTDTIYYDQISYDAIGRRAVVNSASGLETRLNYSHGTKSQAVSGHYNDEASSATINRSRSENFNGFNEVVSSVDDFNNTTTFVYNALGLARIVTGVDGISTTLNYDAYGRRIQMNDADKGIIQFGFNALGENITQTASDLTIRSTYRNAIGQVVKVNIVQSSNNDWDYFDYQGSPFIHQESNGNNQTTFEYDEYHRLKSKSYRFDNKTWQQSIYYDEFGRIFRDFDISGASRGLQYTYQNGTVKRISEISTDKTYYNATSMDARNNITGYTLGNNISVSKSYDNVTGYLRQHYAGLGIIQNQNYRYDQLGNLRYRSDSNGQTSLVEHFTYDSLNRLKQVYLNGYLGQSINYYDNGNIRSKSDVSSGATYQYATQQSQCSNNAGAHALVAIGTSRKYCYDARGNQTQVYHGSSVNRKVTYSLYDKPLHIWSTHGQTDFSYDANKTKYKRVDNIAGNIETTYYVGDQEVVYQANGDYEYKRYIQDIAIHTIKNTGESKLHYVFNDHLGSGSVYTDDQGLILHRNSFDAFGKRRNALNWSGYQSPFTELPGISGLLALTQKGFTGHQQVDHASVVHMGGRIYDPEIGRFMQADPIVQDPKDAQSLNRYSYVYNNPLSYTDPTGYACFKIMRAGPPICTGGMDSDLDKHKSPWGGRGQKAKGKSPDADVNKANSSAKLINAAKAAGGNNVGGGFLDSVSGYVIGLGQSFLDSQAQALAGGIGIEDTESIQSSIRLPISESELGGAELAQSSVANVGMVSSSAMMIANLRNGEFTPSKSMIQGSLSLLVKDGAIDASILSTYVPDSLRNSFMPTDRVPAGQKFRFKIGNTKVSIKWHSPDLGIRRTMPRSNSARVWTAQIQVGKKFLMSNGSWTRKQKSNRTHIPVIR